MADDNFEGGGDFVSGGDAGNSGSVASSELGGSDGTEYSDNSDMGGYDEFGSSGSYDGNIDPAIPAVFKIPEGGFENIDPKDLLMHPVYRFDPEERENLDGDSLVTPLPDIERKIPNSPLFGDDPFAQDVQGDDFAARIASSRLSLDISQSYKARSQARMNEWVMRDMAAQGYDGTIGGTGETSGDAAGSDNTAQSAGSANQPAMPDASPGKAAPPAVGSPGNEQQPQTSATQETVPNQLQNSGDAKQPPNPEKAQEPAQQPDPQANSSSIDDRLRAQGIDPDAIRYDDQGNAWTERELATPDGDSKSGGSGVTDTLKKGWDATKDAAGKAADAVGDFILPSVNAAENKPGAETSSVPPNANPSGEAPLSLPEQVEQKKQDLKALTEKGGTPEELETKRQELQDLMVKNGTATVWPGDNKKINSKFGELRDNPKKPGEKIPHPGLDIKNEEGARVIASDSGVVTNVEPCSGGETRVEITNRDGSKSTYLHTGQPTSTPYVKKGDYVIAGDTIGITDLSGKSTGGHIHYEYRTPDGKLVDPMPHLTKK